MRREIDRMDTSSAEHRRSANTPNTRRAWIAPAAGLVVAMLLSGCETPAQRAPQQALLTLEDERNCQELGFEKGTEAFGNCMLKLRELRAEQEVRRPPNIGFGIGIGVGL